MPSLIPYFVDIVSRFQYIEEKRKYIVPLKSNRAKQKPEVAKSKT